MSSEKQLELSDLNGSKSPDSDSPLPTSKCSERSQNSSTIWILLQIALFVVMVLVVWVLFSLPIIFYETEKTEESDSTTTSAGTSMNASNENATNETMTACSGEQYTGTVCSGYLLDLQKCVPGFEDSNSENVTVTPIFPQAIAETVVGQVFTAGIPMVGVSDACAADIMPFLCLQYFPLCLGGALYEPTQSECFPLRDDVCTLDKWNTANVLLGPAGLDAPEIFRLPACEDLENTTAIEECGGSGSGVQPLQDGACLAECSDGFYCEAGACRSECGEFETSSHNTTVALDAVAIFVGIVSLLAIIAIFITAFLRWKVMFTFPNILNFYSTASVLIIIVILLVQYTDRNTLLCSQKSLVDSASDSTDFCQFAGTTFYYIVLQLTLWWLFQIVFLFCEVVFPERTNTIRKTHWWNVIHLAVFLIGLLVPIYSAAGPHGSNDGYHITRSPPFLCFAFESDDNIDFLILPMMICCWSGVPLLLTAMWLENKWRTCREQWTLDATRFKVFICLFYYLVVIIFVATAFALDGSQSTRYTLELREFFICEVTGSKPDDPCPRDFEDYSFPGITSAAYILLGLYPFPLLIFFINFKAVKQFLCGGRGKYAPAEA